MIVYGGNRVYVTTECVNKVLGIAYTGKCIMYAISKRKLERLQARFSNRSFWELHRRVVEDNVNFDEIFMQTYLLYVLGCFFCPSMKDKASPALFLIVSIASKLREYDWAIFIFNWLVGQVTTYKNKQRNGATPAGASSCLFFFMGGEGEGEFMIEWTDEMVERCIERASSYNDGASSSHSTYQFQNAELNTFFQRLQEDYLNTLYEQLRVVDKRLQSAIRDKGGKAQEAQEEGDHAE